MDGGVLFASAYLCVSCKNSQVEGDLRISIGILQ